MSSISGAKPQTDMQTAAISVTVYDGARQPLSGVPILMTLRNGKQEVVVRDTFHDANVRFTGIQPFDNFGDSYAVIASPSGYADSGFFPVKVVAGVERQVSLLSIPKSNTLNFARARWDRLTGLWSKAKAILTEGAADPDAAAFRYSDLTEYKNGGVSACLLNLLTSMEQTNFNTGTALDLLHEIIWDRSGPFAIAPDRFFGWADPEIVVQLETAKKKGVVDSAPFDLHPGATRSYKQILFGEANLQITLHENDRKEVVGKQCLLIEPDIDYFRDPAAHFFGEVFVNAFGSMTDPRQVLALRWTAGRQAGLMDFDPLYTVDKA